MTDILATHDILGAADPHGATSLVNLYAAMPSLHVAWAAWCATAIVITTRSRWRHLAWLYPAATTGRAGPARQPQPRRHRRHL
jgi:PAP2 superfamily